MKTTITKEFKFHAAHKLGEEEIFGNCSRLHGHTYKLYVTVSSDKLRNGMIINFRDLKGIVEGTVLKDLDHYFLNEVEWMKAKYTTCEVLIREIWYRLEKELEQYDVRLERLRLYETDSSYAEVER